MQQDLSQKSELLRMEKLLKQKEDEQERLKKEQRALELKQRQLDFRKAEEREKTQRVRNIVNENRVRVSLQSELVGNYTRIDPGYRA